MKSQAQKLPVCQDALNATRVWGSGVHADARLPASFQAAPAAQAPALPAPTLFPWQRRGGSTYCSCSWWCLFPGVFHSPRSLFKSCVLPISLITWGGEKAVQCPPVSSGALSLCCPLYAWAGAIGLEGE